MDSERGIHPGSRNNNLLILIFDFPKRETPLSQDGRRKGGGSSFHVSHVSRFSRAPRGGIRANPECGKVTAKNPHLEQIKKHTKRTGAFLS